MEKTKVMQERSDDGTRPLSKSKRACEGRAPATIVYSRIKRGASKVEKRQNSRLATIQERSRALQIRENEQERKPEEKVTQ